MLQDLDLSTKSRVFFLIMDTEVCQTLQAVKKQKRIEHILGRSEILDESCSDLHCKCESK